MVIRSNPHLWRFVICHMCRVITGGAPRHTEWIWTDLSLDGWGFASLGSRWSQAGTSGKDRKRGRAQVEQPQTRSDLKARFHPFGDPFQFQRWVIAYLSGAQRAGLVCVGLCCSAYVVSEVSKFLTVFGINICLPASPPWQMKSCFLNYPFLQLLLILALCLWAGC